MDFPRTIDEITPEWLTQVLRESGAIRDAGVESFESTQLQGGTPVKFTGCILPTAQMNFTPHRRLWPKCRFGTPSDEAS
jgi:hypothetical protein